ncbi:RidA family protein [Sphingomonas lacunae]|uniref:RidA family protein n=1 Tax=Sphingomonas lacunae TaxID=2698828 RepID=A0A6M4AS79_9SPHN|nr:RidA family protein [Sphingomonas lacunae]QJQ31915.1 RidA family protein [Sphingomonas lacunae]
MTQTPEARLAEAGHAIPQAAAPIAAYVPTVQVGKLLHISGQVSFKDGAVVTGRVGETMDVEAGKAAAELCGLMLIAQMKAALGDLSRVERIVKLGVFVTSTPDFTDQPLVANGASELMLLAFGDAGRHARSAVGVPALPRGAAVEVDAVIAIRD